MNTKNFGNGYVGIKINSISEIMKYNALKEQFSIWNEYEGTFDDDVEVTDDDGNVTEREPTENEKIHIYLQNVSPGTSAGKVTHSSFIERTKRNEEYLSYTSVFQFLLG